MIHLNNLLYNYVYVILLYIQRTTASNLFDVFHQVINIDGFVCLVHGKEKDEDYKMNRQLTKTLDIFNHEVRKHVTARLCLLTNVTFPSLF